jgi:hypothetical protein
MFRCVTVRVPIGLLKDRLEVPSNVAVLGMQWQSFHESLDVCLTGDALPKRYLIKRGTRSPVVECENVSDLAEALAE